VCGDTNHRLRLGVTDIFFMASPQGLMALWHKCGPIRSVPSESAIPAPSEAALARSIYYFGEIVMA
jgi:hypothetical protein